MREMRHSLFLLSATEMQMNKLSSDEADWRTSPVTSHGKIKHGKSKREKGREERRRWKGQEGKKIRGEEMRGVRRRGKPASGDCETSQHSWWSTSSLAGGVKGREICFLSSSILSVFVQTSCISSTSCLLPVLADGSFSLICTLLWPALPHPPIPSPGKTFREKANLGYGLQRILLNAEKASWSHWETDGHLQNTMVYNKQTFPQCPGGKQWSEHYASECGSGSTYVCVCWPR